MNDVEKRLRQGDDENLGKEALGELMYPRPRLRAARRSATSRTSSQITLADVQGAGGARLLARSAHHRRRRRLSPDARRGSRRGAVAAAAKSAPPLGEIALAQPHEAARAARREGRALDRDLDGRAVVAHAHRPRLRGDGGRAQRVRRAPPVQRPADAAAARDARPQLRRLRVHRALQAGGRRRVHRADRARAPAAATSPSGCARCRTRTRSSRMRAALYELAAHLREEPFSRRGGRADQERSSTATCCSSRRPTRASSAMRSTTGARRRPRLPRAPARRHRQGHHRRRQPRLVEDEDAPARARDRDGRPATPRRSRSSS